MCNCHLCVLFRKSKALREKLPQELVEEYNELVDELQLRMEEAEADVDYVNSMLAGTWPKNDSDEYHYTIENKRYVIKGTLLNE